MPPHWARPSIAPMALHVSSVVGKLVTRFGTGLLVGAERDPSNPSQVTWSPDRVVEIPDIELAKYGREYRRAISEGALVVQTEAEFKAQVETETKQQKAEQKAASKGEPKAKE